MIFAFASKQALQSTNQDGVVALHVQGSCHPPRRIFDLPSLEPWLSLKLVRPMRLLVFLYLGSFTVSLFAKTPSIDGSYELTERVMADATVRRSPEIVALYTMIDGRFSLNVFVKNGDGTIASESTMGRYTFSADK